MIRHRLITVIVVLAIIIPTLSSAQEGKRKSNSTEAELSSLHKLVEDQSKQIEALTEQVAHLTQLLETEHAAALAATPAPTPVVVKPAAAVPPAQEAPAATGASGVVSPETPGTHVVTKGETLTSIAKHYKITLGDLLKVNKIENDRMLQIGQTLVIPTPTPADNPQEKKENQ
ncbi:MAG: LysM domain-containing protein [Chthoniobacteraceae bacterium]